jgi:ABC-type amino acid transport system permease subunit
MPNIFAFLVLFSFPLVAIALFRTLSLERALVWTLIAGHLLLPSETDIKFPMLPVIDRSSIASVSALILCAIMAPKLRLSLDLPARTGRLVIIGLLALVIVTPILTVLQNAQPVVDGRVFLPGLRLYDAYGLISQILFQMIPFWLGLRYLNTTTGHKALLEAIAIGGLAYTLPALFEIRMSPQLHTWVYGFFPHDFVQAIRDGGFRPVVFLNHGLMVGIFFCMSIISAVVLYREARREGEPAVKWLVAAVWLTLILYLSKNLGALVLAVIFASAAMFLGRRLQTALAVAVAVIVMLYPMLRGAGWIPVDTAYELALSISEERANSLKFRLDNEDALLEHANKKPLAGWGSWGRNSLWDPETGQMTSVTDGIWLIFIGVYGWLGYIGRFGLLTAPILFFALRKRRFGPSLVTPGVLLVLSANLIDLLPNAGLVNYVWLMAGSIAGKAVLRSASDTAETEGTSSAEASDERASWLMPEELSTSQRRQKRSEQRGPLR